MNKPYPSRFANFVARHRLSLEEIDGDTRAIVSSSFHDTLLDLAKDNGMRVKETKDRLHTPSQVLLGVPGHQLTLNGEPFGYVVLAGVACEVRFRRYVAPTVEV